MSGRSVPTPVGQPIAMYGRLRCYHCGNSTSLRGNKAKRYVCKEDCTTQRRYCSSVCQNKDKHDCSCHPAKRNFSARGTFAKEDIRSGDIILMEQPLIILPRLISKEEPDDKSRRLLDKDDRLRMYCCVACHAPCLGDLENPTQSKNEEMAIMPFDPQQVANYVKTKCGVVGCRGCGMPLCSTACDKGMHSGEECKMLAKLSKACKKNGKSLLIDLDRDEAYTLLRVLRVMLLQKKDLDAYKTFRSLELVDLSEPAKFNLAVLVEKWEWHLKQLKIKKQDAVAVLQILEVYAMQLGEIDGNRTEYAVYPWAFSVACVPNTELQLTEGNKLIQKVTVDIAQGTQVTIGRYTWKDLPAYTQPLYARFPKQLCSMINQRLCPCPICSDDTNETREFVYKVPCTRTVKKYHCPGSLIPTILESSSTHRTYEWKCNKKGCQRTMDQDEMTKNDEQLKLHIVKIALQRSDALHELDTWIKKNTDKCAYFHIAFANILLRNLISLSTTEQLDWDQKKRMECLAKSVEDSKTLSPGFNKDYARRFFGKNLGDLKTLKRRRQQMINQCPKKRTRT